MSGITLPQMLRFWAGRWPEQPAIRLASGFAVSWAELDRRTDRVAAGLTEAGVRQSQAVGVLMHNRIEFIEAILATLKIGAIPTILNLKLTPSELLHPVEDADLAAIFTEPDLLHLLSEARTRRPEMTLVTTQPSHGTIPLERLRACAMPPPDPAADENDIAAICYSSGTTGFPKGVMLTHRNIREGALATMVPCAITPHDRVLISAPLAYTWGMMQYFRESLISGCTATIVEPTTGFDEIIDVLIRDRISMWSAVPVMFEQVAARPRFADADFSALRHAISGGSSLHLLDQWQGKGVLLAQAYGLSETGGHVTVLFGDMARERQRQSGQALPGVSMVIRNEQGEDLPCGESGEIHLRGPMVMAGYLNNPEETARTVVDGWLKTGDIGSIDEDGFLTVTGRSKDMIRSGGLNIYPAELERVLAGIRGLDDFTIIGIGDSKWGEVPMIVHSGAEEPDLDALKQRCRDLMAGYKRPKYIYRYPHSLPRTFSGKIQKHELREKLAALPADAILLNYK